MPEKIGDAILELRTDTKKLLKGMEEAKRTADKSMQKMQSRADKFAKFMKGALGIGGVIIAFNGLKRVVGDLVTAYGIQETAETKLKAAIKATGKEASISADTLFDYASELQGMTTFGDEATISALAMLQQLGDLNEEGLKKTIPLVQDFAAAMGVDLETAASLVGKTLGSSTNALSRYGLEVDMTGTKSDKLTALTDAMREKFGGMAKELATTGTGALQQFNNALGDIKEEGGKAVLDIMAPLIRTMTEHLTVTLQDWKATANLNKALKGEATSVYEVDRALSENKERLDEAENSTLMLSERLRVAQDAFDLEQEKIENGTNAMQTQIGVRASALAAIRAQVDANGKEIKKRVENIRLLKKNREEIEQSTSVRTVDVIVTKAQIETQDELNKKIEENLGAWIEQQTQVVGGFQAMTDGQLQLNGLMGTFFDGLIRVNEVVERLPNAYDLASFSSMEFTSGGIKEMEELTEATMRYQIVLQTLAEDTMISFGESLSEAIEVGANGWDFLAQAGKEAIATILEAFAKQWAVEAIAAYASFNIPKGIGMTAASLAAFAGAGFVRSLATGGDFITQGPQAIMVGDNPGGRERVSVTPVSSPNINGPGQMVHVTFNVGSRLLYDDFSRATANGEIIIAPRSIRK